MKRFYLLGFLALVTLDTIANLGFKAAALHAQPLAFDFPWLIRVFGQPWIYATLIGYAGTFLCWLVLLRHAPIGPAYAVSHLEIVSITLFSVWLFDETVAWPQIGAIVLILSGIICLAYGESRSERKAS